MRRKIFLCMSVMLFFCILAAGNLRILSPNGGEIIPKTSPVQLKWETGNIEGKIVITLYKKGVKVLTISNGAPNTGNFNWKIPPDVPPHNSYRIRIRSMNNLAINDFSDRDFSIVP